MIMERRVAIRSNLKPHGGATTPHLLSPMTVPRHMTIYGRAFGMSGRTRVPKVDKHLRWVDTCNEMNTLGGGNLRE